MLVRSDYSLPNDMDVKSLPLKAELFKYTRDFFYKRGVLEVQTPMLSDFATTSPYIKPVCADVMGKNKYLHTSPEYAMKKLLAYGSGCIYQICKAFRDFEKGNLHNYEFLMLEWYRCNVDYKNFIDEVACFVSKYLEIEEVELISYQELFIKYLNIDPHNTNISMLQKIFSDDSTFEFSKHLDLDNCLSLAFNTYIEPKLLGNKVWVVYNYPESQAELAKIESDGKNNVAKRFEIFVDSIELANGYDELTDYKEQERRMRVDIEKRGYGDVDLSLIDALKSGLPECCGVALGLDRLFMLKAQSIIQN